MTCQSRNRLFLNLILSLAVIILPLTGKADSAITAGDSNHMKNINLIAVIKDSHQTTVILRGDGKVPAHRTRVIESPPGLIIDIFCKTASFESINRSVSGLKLNTIRVGHHKKSIRMVLDLNGSDIPVFSVIKKKQ
jgi:hypothetical protein